MASSPDETSPFPPGPVGLRPTPRAIEAPRGLWLWAPLAGLLAGIAAGGAGELTNDAVRPVLRLPADYEKLNSFSKAAALSDAIRAATPPAEALNTALAYGGLGALLGGALGLTGGLARRSIRWAGIASTVGVVAGAAVGSLASMALTYVFYRWNEPESGNMILPTLVHGGIWVPLGAAAGLALGLGVGGLRSIADGLLGGIAGAIVATLVFETFSAISFPLLRVLEPVPAERASRLVAHLVVALGIALAGAFALNRKRVERAGPPPS